MSYPLPGRTKPHHDSPWRPAQRSLPHTLPCLRPASRSLQSTACQPRSSQSRQGSWNIEECSLILFSREWLRTNVIIVRHKNNSLLWLKNTPKLDALGLLFHYDAVCIFVIEYFTDSVVCYVHSRGCRELRPFLAVHDFSWLCTLICLWRMRLRFASRLLLCPTWWVHCCWRCATKTWVGWGSGTTAPNQSPEQTVDTLQSQMCHTWCYQMMGRLCEFCPP